MKGEDFENRCASCCRGDDLATAGLGCGDCYARGRDAGYAAGEAAGVAKCIATLNHRVDWLTEEIRKGGTCYLEREQARACVGRLTRDHAPEPARGSPDCACACHNAGPRIEHCQDCYYAGGE